LWVGSSRWQTGEAAIRRSLTLEWQVTRTLLPDCAIKPPAAQADNRKQGQLPYPASVDITPPHDKLLPPHGIPGGMDVANARNAFIMSNFPRALIRPHLR